LRSRPRPRCRARAHARIPLTSPSARSASASSLTSPCSIRLSHPAHCAVARSELASPLTLPCSDPRPHSDPPRLVLGLRSRPRPRCRARVHARTPLTSRYPVRARFSAHVAVLESTLAFRAPRGARSCPRPRPPCGVRIRAHALSTSRHASSCAHPLIFGSRACSRTCVRCSAHIRGLAYLAACEPASPCCSPRGAQLSCSLLSPRGARGRPHESAHGCSTRVRILAHLTAFEATLATCSPSDSDRALRACSPCDAHASAHCLAVHTFLVHLAMPDSRKSRLAALPPSFTLRCSRSSSLRIQQRPRPGSPRDAPVRAPRACRPLGFRARARVFVHLAVLESALALSSTEPVVVRSLSHLSMLELAFVFPQSRARSPSHLSALELAFATRRAARTSVFPDPLRPSAHVRAHCSGPHPRSRPLDPLRPSAQRPYVLLVQRSRARASRSLAMPTPASTARAHLQCLVIEKVWFVRLRKNRPARAFEPSIQHSENSELLPSSREFSTARLAALPNQ